MRSLLPLAAALALGLLAARPAHAADLHLLPASALPSTAEAALPAAHDAAVPAWGLTLGAGAGAALLSTPLALAGGVWLGATSNDLVVAALPAVLVLAVLPPIVVAWASHWASDGRAAFWPSFWTGLGAEVLAIVGAVALGLAAQNVGHAALFTVANAVLLPGSVALVTALSDPGRPAHAARAPGVPVLALRF